MASIHIVLNRRLWLLALLAALLGAAALPLAPAQAAPPDLKLDLYIKGDSDNVVPPGSVIELGARISFSGPNTAIETDDGFLRVASPYEWEQANGRTRLFLNEQDFDRGLADKAAWAVDGLEADAVFGGQSLLVQDFLIVSTHPVTSARAEEREGRVYVFDLAAKSLVTTISPSDASGSNPVGFGRAIAFYQDAANRQVGYLFIGSPNDAVSALTGSRGGGNITCGFDTAADSRITACAIGRVYIFKIDREASGNARKELLKTLTPAKKSAVAAGDTNSINRGARFGYSLALTPSGDYLVVGAPGMHLSGAGIIFGRGQGWDSDDAVYTAGTKLTPYQVSDDRPSLLDGDDTDSVDNRGRVSDSGARIPRTGNVNVAKAWDGAELGASVAIDSTAEHVVLGAPRKSWDVVGSSTDLTAVNIKGSTCDGLGCTDPLPGDAAITATTARYFGEVVLFQRQRDATGALVRDWRTEGTLASPGNPLTSTDEGTGTDGNADDIPNIGKPAVILRDRDLIGRGTVRDEELLGFSVAISADGQTVAASAPQSPKSLRRAAVTGTNAESGVGSVYLWRRAPHTSGSNDFDGWWTNKNLQRKASTVSHGAYGGSARIDVDYRASGVIRPSDDGSPGSDRGGQFGFGPLSFSSAGDLYIGHSRLQNEADTAGSTFHGQGWVIPAVATRSLPTDSGTNPGVLLMDDASAAAAVAGIRIAPPAPADNGFFGIGGFGIPVDSMDPSPLVVGQPQFSATYSRSGVGSGRVWVFSSKTVDDALGHPPLIDGPVLVPVVSRNPTCEPSDAMAADDDEDATFVCELDLGDLAASNAMNARAEIDIPAGLPDGAFRISGSIDVDGRTITDTLEVKVGKVDEVAEISLAVGTDAEGRSLPTQLTKRGPSSSTMLVLSILNENGTASAPDSTESVLITTNLGKLSSSLKADDRCSGGLVCHLDVSRLNADNSHKIPVTVSHPGTPGNSVVEATVLSSDGEVFRASVPLTFAGDAKTLSISEPATALKNQITIESGEDAENDGVGEGDDNTDTLTLVVSAADESGIAVGVPHRSPRAVITGPNEVNVAETVISTNWTVDNDSETEGSQFAKNSSGATTVTVTVVSSTPLTAGEYTLALRTAGIEAEQRFNVAGPPAAIALSEPEGSLHLGSRLSFTATVSDAAGVAVADGTAVEFQGAAVGGEAALLTLISQSGATKAGEASASWLVLDAGQVFVSASAGGITEVQLFRVGASPLFSVSDTLSSTAPSAFASYLADTPTIASLLLAELEGINSILLWSGAWFRYGVDEAGRVIPGSTDFPITQGSVLYLGG